MPQPYELPASGSGVFRNFVFSIPIDRVKAIEFFPGTGAVHHANMRLDETNNADDAVGQLPDVIAHFRESVRLSPAVPATHFNLSVALAAAGRLDQAIVEYRPALAIRPASIYALNNLGWLRMLGNASDTLASFAAA